MKKILLFFLITLLIPYITIQFLFTNSTEEFMFTRNEQVRVYRNDSKKIENIPLEEYVMGVVAGEMPASFELEALKAQAVASRSYVMYQMVKNKNKDYDVIDTILNQVYLYSNKKKKKWGSKYEQYLGKIKEAVTETAYEYVIYDGKIAETLFFSTSTGYTENSEEIFVSKVPYLRSVESKWDNISPVFNEENKYQLDKFLKQLNLKVSDQLNVKITSKTKGGRIKKIVINEKEFTGDEIVKKFNLRSTCFEIELIDNYVYITTKGYGHGVGMSQYGAQGMALAGYTYDEIIKNYKIKIKIKKIKNSIK